ncbi:MAG TPA: plastocyanin/azurin family copper-binding protein [Chloroflexota bacterium]|jgi:plastocyanin
MLGAIIALMLLTFTLSGRTSIPVAQAAQTWDVQVGGDLEEENIAVNAFLPSSVTVGVGDSVRWTLATQPKAHSVTFLAGAPRPADFVPGPGPGELSPGPGGGPAGPRGPNAAYDGSGLAGSGRLDAPNASPYSLTFTQAGVYDYICTFHPGMNGVIEVLPTNGALAETPTQAQGRGQSQFDSLVTQLRTNLQTVHSAHAEAPGAAGVQTVIAGLSTAAGRGNAGGASALQFLPGELNVRRGDLIVWTVADPLEIHTVTFASAEPPPFADVMIQPGGPPVVIIRAAQAQGTGGTTFTGEGYVNSGILSPGDSFALYVDAPAGSYQYACLVHPNMKGQLLVTE